MQPCFIDIISAGVCSQRVTRTIQPAFVQTACALTHCLYKQIMKRHACFNRSKVENDREIISIPDICEFFEQSLPVPSPFQTPPPPLTLPLFVTLSCILSLGLITKYFRNNRVFTVVNILWPVHDQGLHLLLSNLFFIATPLQLLSSYATIQQLQGCPSHLYRSVIDIDTACALSVFVI